MKMANWYKKLLIGLGLVSSFVVFGSVYQSVQISSTSYMDDSEIKFTKRLDESK